MIMWPQHKNLGKLNFAYSDPVRVTNLLRFTLLRLVFELDNSILHFWGHVTEKSKFWYQKFTRFTPSLVVFWENGKFQNKYSKFNHSWPLSEAWIVIQVHLLVGIIHILTSKYLQKFHEILCIWVFEFTHGLWQRWKH